MIASKNFKNAKSTSNELNRFGLFDLDKLADKEVYRFNPLFTNE